MTQPAGPMTISEVELRLHGVSGTLPAAMLQSPHPQLVAGDEARTSFWRAPSPDPRTGRVLEGYSWGGLTSGGATRALWLLLLPFTLLNVAAWTHPPIPSESPAKERALRRWCRQQRWLRVIALGMTLLVLLTAANLTADLLAFQCAADLACRSQNRIAAWLAALPLQWRLVLGMALGPGAVLALLGFLGQSTWRRFETRRPGRRPVPSGPATDQPRALLEHPGFFDGDAPVRRLRQVHLGSGTALIGLLLAVCARTLADDPAYRAAGLVLALACGGLLVAAAALVLWPALGQRAAPRTPPRCEGPRDAATRAADALALGMRWAGLVSAVAAGVLVVLAVDGSAVRPSALEANLPGLQASVMVVFLALSLAWVVLCCTHPGWTTVVMTAMSMLLASALSAGLALAAASWLGQAVPTATVGRVADTAVAGLLRSGDPRQVAAGLSSGGALVVPPVFFYSALTLLAVTVLLLLLVVPLVWGWRKAALPPGAPDSLYPDEAESLDEATRWQLRRLRRTWYLAGLTDRAGTFAFRLVLGATVLAGAGCLAVNVASVADWVNRLSGQHRTGLAEDIVLLPFDHLSPATKIGVALAGALALGLVGLGRQSLSQAGTRRTVGIIWDLGTFWPRAAHPLAAPCYSERVVPELHDRMRFLLGQGYHLVLSAHSQGTVIAAAALLQMPDGELCQRAGLLTYGSPLRRLYRTYFPAYFGDEAVQRLCERLHCQQADVPGAAWRNLYRGTDPIGGPVFAAAGPDPHPLPQDPAEAVGWSPDWQLVDPPTLAVPAYDIVLPAPRGHSGYWHDPAFGLALDTVFGLLVGPPPDPDLPAPSADQNGWQPTPGEGVPA